MDHGDNGEDEDAVIAAPTIEGGLVPLSGDAKETPPSPPPLL